MEKHINDSWKTSHQLSANSANTAQCADHFFEMNKQYVTRLLPLTTPTPSETDYS